MKYLIPFLVMMLGGTAWGGRYDQMVEESAQRTDELLEAEAREILYKHGYSRYTPEQIAEASERQVRSMGSNQYVVVLSTHSELRDQKFPAVVTSTGGIVSLDSFIKSGALCERIGHRWEMDLFWACGYGGTGPVLTNGQICGRCGRCRQKVKTEKTVYEWED
jgi:hypothetical protein